MLKYIVRRLSLILPVLIGVSIVTFAMLRLIPGDPAVVMLGEFASDEQIQDLRESMGLDEPIHIQYIRYLGNTVSGDLGRSIVTNRPVTEEIAQRLPATIELSLAAMGIATALGITAGVIAAQKHNSLLDLSAMILALIGISMPIFWLGLLLMFLFSLTLGWLPPSGRLTVGTHLATITEVYHVDQVFTGKLGSKIVAMTDVLSNFYVLDSILTGNLAALADALRHLALPALSLSTVPMAMIARMTRSTLLDVLSETYIRTARAKGLRERVVLMTHAMKNALLPIITLIGIRTGSLLAGAILVETIFSWPGMGRLIVSRILARDYPVVQGAVLISAVIFVFVNLLVDLSYAYLDPRIRFE